MTCIDNQSAADNLQKQLNIYWINSRGKLKRGGLLEKGLGRRLSGTCGAHGREKNTNEILVLNPEDMSSET
jgi:hypothetical protein